MVPRTQPSNIQEVIEGLQNQDLLGLEAFLLGKLSMTEIAKQKVGLSWSIWYIRKNAKCTVPMRDLMRNWLNSALRL